MGFSLAGLVQGLDPAIKDIISQARQGKQAQLLLDSLIHGDQGQGGNDPLAMGTTPPPMGATPAAPLPGPPPTSPAAPPPPSFGGPPQAAPMPGATPMPQGPATPPQPGAAPGAGPITAGAGGALGPTPQVQPNGPAPPPPGPPMSGTAQPTGNEFQDSQKTLKSILMDLKQANPKARPADILAAADKQITMMKGLTSETSALLRFQAANMATDQRRDAALQKAQTAEEAMQISVANLRAKLDSAERIAAEHNLTLQEDTQAVVEGRHEDTQTNAASRQSVAGTNAGARLGAASIGASSREKVAETGAGARRYAADKGFGGAQVRADATVQAADRRAQATEYSAEAGAKGRSFQPIPARPGASAAAPVKVKTPAEANKLKPGTVYQTPDGQTYTR